MTEPTTICADDASLLHRDPLALAMFAAWCNLPVDKLPEAMRAHTCAATAEAWGRAAAAVRSFMLSDEVVNNAALAAANWENERLDMPTLASFEEFRFQSDANVFVGLARVSIAAAITPNESFGTSGEQS